MRKGQAELTEVLFVIIAIVISIVIMILIFQKTIADMQLMASITSADSLSRSLTDVITTSNAAPGDLKIKYQPSEEDKYNLNIESKNVKVEKLGTGGRVVERSLVAVPSDVNANFQNINQITVVKEKGKLSIEGSLK